MYTILVLVSLAAAVSCHHAIPDPFGDDSVGQARIKRLGELDDSISRLVARAMNLKSALTQRLKNKEEADRKAKNILLRLDRMNVDDGVQRCADTDKDFRCRRSSKCIKNILVCDGKKDCDDGTDEDKDLCRFPIKEGEEWSGKMLYNTCLNLVAQNATVRWTHFDRRGNLKSVLQVNGVTTWDYRLGTDGTMNVVSPWTLTYNYGNQRASATTFFNGVFFTGVTQFMPDFSFADSVGYIGSTATSPCSRSIIAPKENH